MSWMMGRNATGLCDVRLKAGLSSPDAALIPTHRIEVSDRPASGERKVRAPLVDDADRFPSDTPVRR
jgi:hypothetical protein